MLYLRPYKDSDADSIVSWIKDETTFRMWCADKYNHYPITAKDMIDYYNQVSDDYYYKMTAFDETGAVGHLIMRFTDEEKQILRFGFIIVDSTKRGKGYGKEMLQLALKYAFEILKVNKVTLGVFEKNPSAYYCYQSIGFTDTGQSNQYHMLNEELKCLEFEILSSNYNENNQ